AAAPGWLVLAADVVPDVDRDDRRLAVGVHHHPQAVGQDEALVGDVDDRGIGGGGGGGQRDQAGSQREAKGGGQQGAAHRAAEWGGERHAGSLQQVTCHL